MAKYKPGQTWPKGAFSGGLMLTYSDEDLRKGSHESRRLRKHQKKYHPKLKPPPIFYPAGKPLKTDTEIRRFRKKHIFGPHRFGGKSKIEWIVGKWK